MAMHRPEPFTITPYDPHMSGVKYAENCKDYVDVRVGICFSEVGQERLRGLLLTSAQSQSRAILDCAVSFPRSSHVQSPPSGFTLTTYHSYQIPECVSHLFLGASIAEAGTTIADLNKLASVMTRTPLVTAGDGGFF